VEGLRFSFVSRGSALLPPFTVTTTVSMKPAAEQTAKAEAFTSIRTTKEACHTLRFRGLAHFQSVQFRLTNILEGEPFRRPKRQRVQLGMPQALAIIASR
jgi:hypothetical protein